jgi:cytochrome c556
MGTTNMKRILTTGALLLSSLVSFNTLAAELSPEQQAAASIGNRQAVFKLLSVANGPLGGMARGGAYDDAAAKLAAERVQMLAGMIPALFTADTRNVNSGVLSRANSSIWDNRADFDALAADLAAGAASALEILGARGAEGVRDAVGAIGPKCGACHDRFRLETAM